MKASAVLALSALLALAIFEARGEAAAESTIRSGIYSDSTCADPGFLWVYVPDITIDIDRSGTDDSVSIGFLIPDSEPLVHGWQRFRNEYSKDETFEYFLRMATGDRVQLLWWDPGPANASEPPRRLWSQVLPADDVDAGEYWNLATYAKCDSIPFPLSLLHGEPAAFLFSLGPAIRSCRSGQRSCIDEVFGAVDIHPDGALSTAEWARLIRVILYFSLAYGEKSKSEKLGAAYAISVLAVPLAAARAGVLLRLRRRREDVARRAVPRDRATVRRIHPGNRGPRSRNAVKARAGDHNPSRPLGAGARPQVAPRAHQGSPQIRHCTSARGRGGTTISHLGPGARRSFASRVTRGQTSTSASATYHAS